MMKLPAVTLVSTAIFIVAPLSTVAFTTTTMHNVMESRGSCSLGYSSTRSSQELDYISFPDDFISDEDLFRKSSLSTFDLLADSYRQLPEMGSGSKAGEPSMMITLRQKEQDLMDLLELKQQIKDKIFEIKRKQQSLYQHIAIRGVEG
jgi:hypothetical protein